MVRVMIRVERGEEQRTIITRAPSIRRALDEVGREYPGGDLRVIFPLDPDLFFVREVGAVGSETGVIARASAEKLAG